MQLLLTRNVILVMCVCCCWCWCLVESATNSTSSYSEENNGKVLTLIADPIISELVVNGDVPKMAWMARLFDHHDWSVDMFEDIDDRCGEDLTSYLHGLGNGSVWAAKMNDASGRYNDQFFFGNDFWLGSSTSCKELQDPEHSPSIPEFSVYFYVAKVLLDIDHRLTPTKRQLHIGLCLPESCKPSDVRKVLEKSAERAVRISSPGASIEVLAVRPVPGDYDLFRDLKFQIVGGVGAVVVLLVLMSSCLEGFIGSRRNKVSAADIEIQNSNNNNVDDVKNNETVAKGGDKSSTTSESKAKKEVGKSLRDLPKELLLCFSALTNGRKILQFEKLPDDAIKCIHGLRFLSIGWIILVHTYLEVFAVAENKTLRIVTERNWIYQTISNATYSVDTFFFISGLLVTMLYFRTAKKSQASYDEKLSRAISRNTSKFFVLLFYRIARLTPAYLFVLGIQEVVLRYYHNYSVFEPNFYDHITCDNYWWRNALYINTFYPQREICMLWSWYMSNDTQFYILAVILLLIAVRGERHFKFSASVVGVFLVSSWITTFSVAYVYDYHARIEEPFALFDELYDKPWTRIGPYLVGMATGWLLFRLDCKLKMNPTTVVVGWVLSVACLASLVYGLGKNGLTVPVSAFYVSLGHTAWGLSLAWITVACTAGYGWIVDSVLSFRGFLPLSRLTYCAYLVHPMIMCVTSFQIDGPIHLHNGMVLVLFFGNVVVSFLMSLAISLSLEAPVIRLLKVTMGGRDSKHD